jgi:hypothetical protein
VESNAASTCTSRQYQRSEPSTLTKTHEELRFSQFKSDTFTDEKCGSDCGPAQHAFGVARTAGRRGPPDVGPWTSLPVPPSHAVSDFSPRVARGPCSQKHAAAP